MISTRHRHIPTLLSSRFTYLFFLPVLPTSALQISAKMVFLYFVKSILSPSSEIWDSFRILFSTSVHWYPISHKAVPFPPYLLNLPHPQFYSLIHRCSLKNLCYHNSFKSHLSPLLAAQWMEPWTSITLGKCSNTELFLSLNLIFYFILSTNLCLTRSMKPGKFRKAHYSFLLDYVVF